MSWWPEIKSWLITVIILFLWVFGFIIGSWTKKCPDLSRYELQTLEELKYFSEIKDYICPLLDGPVESIILSKDHYTIFYVGHECDKSKLELHYIDWKKHPQKILNSF